MVEAVAVSRLSSNTIIFFQMLHKNAKMSCPKLMSTSGNYDVNKTASSNVKIKYPNFQIQPV